MSSTRGTFNSKFGFILAAAGSAVGLGNIWGFPFQVGKSGGAVFVLIYLAFCFILCYPVMLTEVAIGRKTRRNPVGAFRALGFRRWAFIGKLGIISGFLILSFYNVLAAWSLGYFIEMVRGNFSVGRDFTEFTANLSLVTLYSVLFMAATALIVSGGVKGGIERAAKFLMPSLVLIIMFLVAYSFTLPNAGQGIEFYLVPDFSKLTLSVVYSALGQAFFSLSLGMGALITYGSYFPQKEDIIGSVAYITLADVGIAFTAGLMMFPFVFSQGIAPTGGAGLIFVTLPGVFTSFIHYFGSDTIKSFMAVVIDLANNTFLPLGGFLLSVFAGHVWKKENLSQELTVGNPKFSGSMIEKYIGFAIVFLCPVLLGTIVVLTMLDLYFGIKILT